MTDTNNNLNFVFEESKPDLLKLKVGDKTYAMNHTTGEAFIDGVKQTAADDIKKVEENMHSGFKDAFKEFAKGTGTEITEAQVDTVKKSLTHLESKFAASAPLGDVRKVITDLGTLEAELQKAVVPATVSGGSSTLKKLTVAEADKIKGLLVKHPDAINLLPEASVRVLQSEATGGIAINNAVNALRRNIKTFEDALKSESYTKESITKLLAQSEKGIAEHLPEALKKEFSSTKANRADPTKSIPLLDIEALGKEVETKAASLEAEALTYARKALTLHGTGKTGKKVDDVIASLNKLSSENSDYANRIGKHVHENLSEVERATFGKINGGAAVMSTYSKASTGAAASAAKTGEDKIFSLFKGENKLKELAQKEGVAVEKLGFMKKLRPGKTAAVLGILGVGVAYLAGIGRNPENGKYANDVSKSRENETAPARG